MKLENTGNKIINLCGTALLPGDSMEITKQIAELPAVQTFVRMGFARVSKVEKPMNNPVVETAPEQEAPAKEEPKTTGRGRKKVTEEKEAAAEPAKE